MRELRIGPRRSVPHPATPRRTTTIPPQASLLFSLPLLALAQLLARFGDGASGDEAERWRDGGAPVLLDLMDLLYVLGSSGVQLGSDPRGRKQ